MGLDLGLRGGRVIDPSQGMDGVMDVGFEDGRVAKIGSELSGAGVREVSGRHRHVWTHMGLWCMDRLTPSHEVIVEEVL